MTTSVRAWFGRDERPPTSGVSPIRWRLGDRTRLRSQKSDHVREGVVGTGRTSSNLGRQPDPTRRRRQRSHSRARLEVPRPNHGLTHRGHIMAIIKEYLNYSLGIDSNHPAGSASEGIRQSPRGDRLTVPTFGPSGTHDRLNCWRKNRV